MRSQAPRVPSFNEDDVGDKPGIWKNRGKLSGSRIYDLSVDPYQLDNIAGSAPQALLDNLQKHLDALATCGAMDRQRVTLPMLAAEDVRQRRRGG